MDEDLLPWSPAGARLSVGQRVLIRFSPECSCFRGRADYWDMEDPDLTITGRIAELRPNLDGSETRHHSILVELDVPIEVSDHQRFIGVIVARSELTPLEEELNGAD